MRFGVPRSDSESGAEEEEEEQPPRRKQSPKNQKKVNHRHPLSKSTTNNPNDFSGTYSTPTHPSNSFLSRSLNHSLSGSTRKAHPSKSASANLGLPVPTSDTTPSPFAVVPHNLKSSTSGFPINRSSLRIRLDEQTSFSSDEGEEEDEQPDSEEEQWPIKRCDPGAPNKALESFNIPHLLPDDDPVLVWEQQERQSTYQLSIQNATARRRHFEGIHVRTLARANENNEQQHKQQMNELSQVLARIGLDKEREMRLVAEEFEKRERERARIFEALISEAEKLEQEELLRLNRIRQEEAARTAELERQELLKQQQLEERKRKEAETKRKLEQEHQDLLERQKKEAEELKLSEAQASTIKSVRDDYKKWYSTIQQFKSTVLPTVSASESFKTLCRQAKRRITPKVGQLTNGSRQIEKVILEVGGVLNETRKHDESVYLWVCNHLAKAVIRQAETEVTAKLSTVYPLGRLVVGLMMIGYPEVGTILMGRLVKKCYFVAAYRPLPEEGQSEADYRKQLGYQPENSSREESRVQYNNRMAGLVALFAAIKQTDPSDVVPSLKGVPKQEQLQRIPPELRLDSSWKWLANTLKLPLIFLTATPRVLASFLEVAGQRLFEIYGSQFIKFLKTLLDHGILNPTHPSLKFNWNDIDCKPSIFQLQGLIEDFLNKGKLLPDPHLNPTGRFYQLTYD
ncbi:hypothetical protein PGT21_021914 [Puccinia graminis f. sp. tritici]|uniref:mRNA export factor GLE1 n=1 Tax=Puccinia graminis f. sp. tritici TaxID=56615 RepID=A0A5B0QE89_PUCGR|nr:hypothetical protein PGT21_021914 [Puccinia graminis f. sp. tritici]KAA1111439.1 hypothetical protein PGTUg99_007513 [Puccinia graminis f. sp. tritici]